MQQKSGNKTQESSKNILSNTTARDDESTNLNYDIQHFKAVANSTENSLNSFKRPLPYQSNAPQRKFNDVGVQANGGDTTLWQKDFLYSQHHSILQTSSRELKILQTAESSTNTSSSVISKNCSTESYWLDNFDFQQHQSNTKTVLDFQTLSLIIL